MNFQSVFGPIDGPVPSNLVTLLRGRAAHQPELHAYSFRVNGEDEEVSSSYAQLDRKARAIAAQLQSLSAAGQPALLLFPPGLDYIAAFFGCLYANVIAVPVNLPRRNKPNPRLNAILADSGAAVVLTTEQLRAAFQSSYSADPRFRDLSWLCVDWLPEGLEDGWREPTLDPDTVAYLQYTSGSTGAPKGVILTHGNLLHNLGLISGAFEATNHSRGVIWLPPYHDMGLIGGILVPAFARFPVMLLSPTSFLQKPYRWLKAISDFKATISGGPNFAYELCLQKITPEQRSTLDLSSWNAAFNGAEPIRAETLEKFANTFESCGFRREAFYPCYGLAEATLIVSGGSPSASPITRTFDDTKTLVGCGHALAGQTVAIVDAESGHECTDGVGEIWISGPSVARGYWNKPEETEQTFGARLVGNDSQRFLRTGDLGFQRDGELFVTGRLKDLIIIRGANHYPQDIELTVEKSHASLMASAGAAFSVDVDGDERLVVFHELSRHHDANLDEVASAIREAISEHHDLEAYAVVLLRLGAIPRTSSGKIQRHACRAIFVSGLDKTDSPLDVVHVWTRSRANVSGERATSKTGSVAVKGWLVTHIANRLGIDARNVEATHPFARFGLDSAAAVSMSGELEEWLGRPVSPTLVWEYPTIEALASYLAGEKQNSKPDAAITSNSRLEPIAIIGIGCRFPRANGPSAFWRLLRDGVDAITEVPADRWDPETLSKLDLDEPSRANLRWGGFLSRVDEFDASFFGISEREAMRMDPQQRLLLEVTWEALADAGQISEQISASRTGVFVGISNDDYGRIRFDDPTLIDPYACTGNALSVAANRISYLLNLRGPSMAVDTACSSSLVAVHLACQSIWSDESTMALAAGVNLILTPWVTLNFARSGFMGSDGRCKAFDAKADGYARGEGCGVVVLKRLSQAVTDRNPIYAVIRSSAVNQDGRSNGLTAPNREAQEQVLIEAYHRAGISPGLVQYVEAHGTGTYLGDPIEAKALGSVVARNRAENSVCRFGSVKTNIGHLEAAAGIAGLIKVALALKNEVIPPSLHFSAPNPHIRFDDLPLRVQDSLAPWLDDAESAIAGVSSFGFGGTNAHVVMERAPRTPKSQPLEDAPAAYVLALSAHTPEALASLAAEFKSFLEDQNESPRLRDVCYTACVRRNHDVHRIAVIGRTREDFIEKLGAYLRGAKITSRIEADAALEALCDAYIKGGTVDFAALFPEPPLPVALPSYPWQRKRYWIGDDDSVSVPLEKGDGRQRRQEVTHTDTGLVPDHLPLRGRPTFQEGQYEHQFAQQLEQTLPRERRDLILSQVQQQVNKLLSLAPANHLEPNKPLNELGLDSLMAVELRNSLSSTIGVHLPTTFLFEYPTIDAITAYLADRLLAPLEKTPKTPTKKDPAFEVAQLDTLSEEQLAALLEEKLAAIEAVEFR